LCADWLTVTSNPGVDRLVDESGMSTRSVERLAKRIYGASPKLWSRKYRALQTAVQIGTGEIGGWGDLACADFHDQAHFIREFKKLIGMMPTGFQDGAAAVNRLTTVRKRLMPDMPKLALYNWSVLATARRVRRRQWLTGSRFTPHNPDGFAPL